MAKDLRGGLNNNSRGAKTDKATAGGNNSGEAQDLLNKYGNKSESELMGELLRSVDKGRSDGSLDEGELERFASSVSGMLSPEQYNKMRSIIDTIKKRR